AGTSRAHGSRLENPAKDDVEVFAIGAAKCRIDAHHDAGGRVEAEADPVVVLERLEIEILASDRNLSGVVEDRGVECRPDLPAIFALQQNRGLAAESIPTKTAEGVVAAERRQQEERHAL